MVEFFVSLFFIVCSSVTAASNKCQSKRMQTIHVMLEVHNQEFHSLGQIENGRPGCRISQVKHSPGFFWRSLMFIVFWQKHQCVAMGYCTLLGLRPTCKCYIFIAVRNQQLHEAGQRICFSTSLKV